MKLDHCRLGVDGLAHLVTALRGGESKLLNLELRGNRLGIAGAKEVAAVLEFAHSLRQLGLG